MKTKKIQTTLSSSSKEIVAVDFLEFDEIRRTAKEFIMDYKKAHPRGGGSWITSGFYIGRGTTSIYMREINLPYLAVTKLKHTLARYYGEYIVDQDGHNLRVYLR